MEQPTRDGSKEQFSLEHGSQPDGLMPSDKTTGDTSGGDNVCNVGSSVRGFGLVKQCVPMRNGRS